MQTDVLGLPYLADKIQLTPDDEGEVVATLVHRPTAGPTTKAVLQVHGFADYFFQTAAADFWTAQGYDFYALDLRKYGRSLLPGQTPAYVEDLSTYYEELDTAYEIIAATHDQIVVAAHSTGGLTVSLWAEDHKPALAGLFLNAPWLDLADSILMRTAGTVVVDQMGSRNPRREIPRKVTGFYARSLAEEWDFNTDWRPIGSFPIYAGWLRAIRRGHARVAKGLEIAAPILVMSSDRHARPETYEDPDQHATDTVLDVEQIRRRAPLLGRHVTLIQVPGAIHDVTLSREPVRAVVFDQLAAWLDAFVRRTT